MELFSLQILQKILSIEHCDEGGGGSRDDDDGGSGSCKKKVNKAQKGTED